MLSAIQFTTDTLVLYLRLVVLDTCGLLSQKDCGRPAQVRCKRWECTASAKFEHAASTNPRQDSHATATIGKACMFDIHAIRGGGLCDDIAEHKRGGPDHRACPAAAREERLDILRREAQIQKQLPPKYVHQRCKRYQRGWRSSLHWRPEQQEAHG